MVANCAAKRGLGRWGSVSVGSSGLASIRMRALRPLPITGAHGVGAECDTFMFMCVCAFVQQWQNDEGLAGHLQNASSD